MVNDDQHASLVWRKAFCADRPDWMLDVAAADAPAELGKLPPGNCMGNKPFLDWLTRVNLDGLATGYYQSWAMDGDFFGTGGWYTTVVPVKCRSDRHDHLPGDANYACQRALGQLIESVRGHYPNTYIFTCRPPQDLGVWSLRNVDACFTLLESGTGDNLTAGDQIRHWSRIRVHRDFFPHYIDQPLLFPSRERGEGKPPNWPKGHLDYILLAPCHVLRTNSTTCPRRPASPRPTRSRIRKWLDWGRKHAEYLKVRKDLPDWPAVGKVDGSAHVVGDRGVIFFFNPGKKPLDGEFVLSEQSIGLRGRGSFRVRQVYPPSQGSIQLAFGKAVRWKVPGQTALLLDLQPAR